MFVERLFVYFRKNGFFYGIKDKYYQYRLKYGKGWQLCGFDIDNAKKRGNSIEGDIKISVLVPVFNTQTTFLQEMLESVLWQTYGNWELCIVDASDIQHKEVSDICQTYAKKEERIYYKKVQTNRGIVGNTNACLSEATGEYIALLDHDDILHPRALEKVIQQIHQNDADYIYTDEAVFEKKIQQITSMQIKPDFSPENLRGSNYICHLCVFSRKLQQQVGEYRKEFEGSQDYDMVLRLTEKAKKICHVPEVLYYWRRHSGSVAAGIATKSYASEAGRKAVQEHLQRQKLSGDVVITEESEVVYRVKYSGNDTGQEQLQVVTIDNNENVQMAQNSEYVLLIQDCISELNEEDIQVLKAFAGRQEVGMVTGSVLNEKGRILQGPNIITERGEIQHLFQGHPIHSVSSMSRMLYAQNVELTGAGFCLIKRELYQNCEAAMQKGRYSVYTWQMVSLELSSRGYQNIYVPWVMAYCRKGKKMDLGMERLPLEWSGHKDKYSNPLFSLMGKWIGV